MFRQDAFCSTDETILQEDYCHLVWSDCSRGFGFDIRFIDHVNTQYVITINYSVIVNPYNSQITTAPATFFSACCVFTSLSLVTASNSEDSLASRVQVRSERRLASSCLFSSQTPVQN
jgi:hypothetical protein